MKINQTGVFFASALGLAGATCLSSAAFASGFALREGTADWLGNAFAGESAKAYDASTVWSNPAGMVRLDQDEIDGAVSYIGPSFNFSGTNSNPLTGGNVSGTTGGNAIAPAASGSLFGVWALSPRFRLGFSVTSPFGERISYPGDFVGRYQSLVSSITDINFGLALSYKVNDHLSIGGGPNIDYFDARLTQALNVPVLSAATGQNPIADTHGNDLGVGYNIGILYQFNDATRIGVDYRSRIRHNITGEQKITVPAIFSLLSPETAALLNAANSAATTSITLPDDLDIGLYHQITQRWAVMGSIEWTDWSLFNTLNITPTNGAPGTTIQEHWRNTWYAGIGTNYQLLDNLMLQTGFGYDESPVTDSNRTTRVPDADHYDLGFGAQYQILPSTSLQLAYLHVFSPGGTINNTSSNTPPTPSGTIIGSYTASDNSVTAGLTVKF
jgi:long-chain fatty acid transport protein